MNDYIVKTPVLLIGFNRPDKLLKVINTLKKVRPSKVYFAVDGPREFNEEDVKQCSEVKEFIKNIDWECDLKINFRESNLGCKYGPANAISWIFEFEEMAIILEDDCVPSESFFRFCDELLEKYKNEENVYMISGNNFLPSNKSDNSYYYSKYHFIWGWATWKRAWDMMDLELSSWPHINKKELFKDLSFYEKEYWNEAFKQTIDGIYTNNVWDFQWLYSMWKNNAVSIIPPVNLVTNIGFGDDGTHTMNLNEYQSVTAKQLSFPLKHPECIKYSNKIDRKSFMRYFTRNSYWILFCILLKKNAFLKRNLRKIKKSFKGK